MSRLTATARSQSDQEPPLDAPYPLHAHPRGAWQRERREMHIFPHAYPEWQIRQHPRWYG